jgi:hypothetical protein
MMKSLSWIIALVITVLIAMWALPWWGIVIPGLAMGYFSPLKPFKTFLLGLGTVFVIYLIVVVWIDSNNDGILSNRIGILFSNIGGKGVIVISSLLGGLLGGGATATGSSLRLINQEK